MKLKTVFDVECLTDYFMVGFKRLDTGAFRQFEMFEGHPFERAEVLRIMQSYTNIGFNSNNYDLFMTFAALREANLVEGGFGTWAEACAKLKEMSDAIIQMGLRPWQTEQQFDLKLPAGIDSIDLMEVVPGVQISLKLYGARLHSKRVQDLPFEHDARLAELGPGAREMILAYNRNDLDTTHDLWNEATKPEDNIIETRELLTAEFGIDVRSKSDAQIAETIIKARVEKLKGERIYKSEIRPGTSYRYNPPAFLNFRSEVMQQTFKAVCESRFVVGEKGSIVLPPALAGLDIKIGNSVYRMGIGGLHSTEKRTAHVASKYVLLRDRDVNSFYPALILQCGLNPPNMGEHFQRVYKDFFDRRLTAKKAGHKSTAQTLKIFLNGAYGKLGSKYSVLYAPNLLIQVTLTGQLVLLMMIERMEAAGIPVVSANTDGIVMACPAHLEATMLEIVKQWEIETGLETEETQYTALYSRDVNSYLAIKPDGKVKVKGALAKSDAQHNPTNEIAKKAVVALLTKGEPIAQTVIGCTDIRQFVSVQRVTGGCQLPRSHCWRDDWYDTGTHWEMRHGSRTFKEKRKSRPRPIQVTEHAEYLGKTVRWYRSTRSNTHLEYVKTGSKVASSDNAMPVMELPSHLPDDIDYAFYIAEANNLLRDIGALNG